MIQFRNDNRNTPNLSGSKLNYENCLYLPLPSFVSKVASRNASTPIFCALEKRESLECEISSGSFRFDEVC